MMLDTLPTELRIKIFRLVIPTETFRYLGIDAISDNRRHKLGNPMLPYLLINKRTTAELKAFMKPPIVVAFVFQRTAIYFDYTQSTIKALLQSFKEIHLLVGYYMHIQKGQQYDEVFASHVDHTVDSLGKVCQHVSVLHADCMNLYAQPWEWSNLCAEAFKVTNWSTPDFSSANASPPAPWGRMIFRLSNMQNGRNTHQVKGFSLVNL